MNNYGKTRNSEIDFFNQYNNILFIISYNIVAMYRISYNIYTTHVVRFYGAFIFLKI